jgi:hypothetical protein
MKMRRLLFLVTTMLLMGQGASAWNGSGSSGDPYLIASPADWETFATSTDEYSDTFFKLTADITVTTMRTATFSGTFDGGGHTLTFNYTATGNNAAPFAYITGATIKNLRVAGTINTGYKFAAGIVAISNGGSIENCQSSVTIASSTSGDGTHGGLVADSYTGTLNITNCLFDGKLLGENTTSCGGIVGYHKQGTLNITNTLFAPAEVTVQGGAIFARNGATSLTNCYYKSTWSATTVQGENAGGMTTASLVTALNNGGTNWCNNGGNATPILIFDYIGNQSNWNAFTSGINAGINYSGKTVKMSADFTATTMATSTFSGTFDGGGHTLTFNYTATGNNAAPFAYITGATIKNLRVAGTINAGGYKFAAGIVSISNGGSIENCRSSVTINSSKDGDGTHGGLVAYQESGTLTINNCLFDGELLGASTSGCGGFVGWVANNSSYHTYISNSLFAPANITVTAYTFCRQNKSTLHLEASTCYYITPSWTASTVQGENAGSMTTASLVTALNNGDKNWCVHRGNAIPIMVNLVISTKAQWDTFAANVGNYDSKYVQLGANIGTANDPITTMTTSATSFKGIFDGNGYTLTVNLSGSSYTAPFSLLNDGTIMNLHVEGSVTVTGDYGGGLVCRTSGGDNLIDNCVVNTNVNGVSYIGGVIAHAYNAKKLTISNCVYGGTLTQSGGYIGGIFGWYNNNNNTNLNLIMHNCLFKGTYVGNGQFHPIGVKKLAATFSNLDCRDCFYTANPTTPDDPDRFFTDGTKVSELTIGTTGVSIASGSYATFQGTKYYYGTVTLGYNGPMATTNFSLDGTHLNDNSFTISTDNAAFDDGTATIKWDFPGRGTVGDPYQISSAAVWDFLADDVNSGTNYSGKYFRLENDLDYSGVTVDGGSNFTPIGWASDFCGNFDGQGHTISGVMIESTAGSQGIFGTIGTAATVKNLVIANSNITGGNNTGAVVGMANGNIENCHVLGDVIIAGTGVNHGGIAGYGNVIACTSAAIIRATNTPAGGIVGSGDANNCLYYGTILPAYASTIGTLTNGNVTNYQTYDATTTSHKYARVYDADPGIMGTVTKTYADTGYKVYEKGVSYGGKFYTDVVVMTEDGITDLTAYAGKTIDAAFNRSFDALGTSTGTVHAATICLPFSFAKPNASVGTFYTFGGVTKNGDDYTVTMTEVSGTEITAGIPYMFVPAGSGATVFENAAFNVPAAGFTAAGKTEDAGGWAFTGTYTKLTWASGQTRLYGFAGTNFKTGDGSALNDIGAFRRFDYGTTAAFRCYLMAPGTAGTRGSGAALPETMRVVLKGADGSITGIGTIDTMTGEATLDGNGPWYTLGGQYLQGKPSRPGIYIHNGKKVVIK